MGLDDSRPTVRLPIVAVKALGDQRTRCLKEEEKEKCLEYTKRSKELAEVPCKGELTAPDGRP